MSETSNLNVLLLLHFSDDIVLDVDTGELGVAQTRLVHSLVTQLLAFAFFDIKLS